MFFYNENLLHVGNYVTVTYVEKDLIIIICQKFKLEIYGENLSLENLSDSDLFVKGNIKEMDLKDVF